MISNRLSDNFSNLLSGWFFLVKNPGTKELNLDKLSGKFLRGHVSNKKATIPVFRNLVSINSVSQITDFREGLFVDVDMARHNYNITQAVRFWHEAPNGALRVFKIRNVQYYVGNGILMDSNGTVLLLATIDVSDKTKKVNGTPVKYLTWDKPTVHINPVVFLDKKYDVWKKLFCEGITCFQKEIPYFWCSKTSVENDLHISYQISIVVDDPSKFVVTIPRPGRNLIEEDLTTQSLIQALPLLDGIMI